MRASVRPMDEQPWNAALEKKKRLKALSDEKVKNWPNTLEALRKKKESFLKDRAALEELKRQEIDKQVMCPYMLTSIVDYTCVHTDRIMYHTLLTLMVHTHITFTCIYTCNP